jgi:phosphocarrier protein
VIAKGKGRDTAVKLSCHITVKNELGLHARPASMIVKMLQEVKSSVHFTLEEERVSARSIVGILMLAASKDSILLVDVEGEDADLVMRKLVWAFDKGFEE